MEQPNFKLLSQPYEISFLLGLGFYTVGQFLIFVWFDDIDALHAQEPIDFAHWSMLIGVLMLTPLTGKLPKSALNIVGVPLLILGVGLIIGMCVLDFVFWSINQAEFKRKVADHLINTTELWWPFMTISGKIFNLGLLILSFSYYTFSKAGPLTVLVGTVVIYIGFGWVNVVGYSIVIAGFGMIFLFKNQPASA